MNNHINILELIIAEYVILTFTYFHPTVQTVHIQMYKMVALKHLVQMGVGGTHNKILTELSKETWITCSFWHGTFREIIIFKKNFKKSGFSTTNA